MSARQHIGRKSRSRESAGRKRRVRRRSPSKRPPSSDRASWKQRFRNSGRRVSPGGAARGAPCDVPSSSPLRFVSTYLHATRGKLDGTELTVNGAVSWRKKEKNKIKSKRNRLKIRSSGGGEGDSMKSCRAGCNEDDNRSTFICVRDVYKSRS